MKNCEGRRQLLNQAKTTMGLANDDDDDSDE